MQCKRCGEKVQKVGKRAYVSGIYQMYKCTRCGHQFRGNLLYKNLYSIRRR